MHVPEELVFDAVYTLLRLLWPGGTLAFSIHGQRPGIDPNFRPSSMEEPVTPQDPAWTC
jgi:hypothetical protein